MVVDAREKEINVGNQVRYTETGTIGEVLEIKEENNTSWVKIDKTGMWYVSDLVEVLDEKDMKETTSYKENTKDVDIEDIKKFKEDLENVELDSNVAEGGG